MKLIALFLALCVFLLNAWPLIENVSINTVAMHCEATCCASATDTDSGNANSEEEHGDNGCDLVCNPFSLKCSCTMFQLPTVQQLCPASTFVFNIYPLYSQQQSQAHKGTVWEPPQLI